MANNFGAQLFTPLVKALQEKYGSRRQYARREAAPPGPDRLSPPEIEFLAERDSFYMATVSENGWPYVQHRGGAPGFLKVVDDHTLAFADYHGNKQYISTGNLAGDNRVALILVDYPARARLKLLGRAKVHERGADDGWINRLRAPGERDPIERAYVITVEALDWNCPQHITPRFTQEQIRDAFAPYHQRLEALEKENERLRRQLSGEP